MTKETYEVILSSRDTKGALVQDNFKPVTDLKNHCNFSQLKQPTSLHVDPGHSLLDSCLYLTLTLEIRV